MVYRKKREWKRDKTMIKTGLQKSQKYPGMFAYLQYQKLGIIFFTFMTKSRQQRTYISQFYIYA